MTVDVVTAGLLSAVGLAVGGGLAVARRRRRTAARAMRDAAALPLAIEICVVVLGAGGTISDSVRALAANGPPPVRGPSVAAVRQAESGRPFDTCLRAWRAELGPSYQPLTGALLLAWEQGGTVGALLDRLAAEAATARRRQGDLRVRRLPVALLVPLVGCSLPAVVIGALLPLALVSFRQVVS
ncbi:MAG: type II secretion system F family protein [Actinomycetota bacterium]